MISSYSFTIYKHFKRAVMTRLTELNSALFFFLNFSFLYSNQLQFRFYFSSFQKIWAGAGGQKRGRPLPQQTSSLCARLMCVSTQTRSHPMGLFTRQLISLLPLPHVSPTLLWPPPLPSVAPATDTSCWFTSSIGEDWWPRPGFNKMCRSHHSWAYRQPRWGRRRSNKKKPEVGSDKTIHWYVFLILTFLL